MSDTGTPLGGNVESDYTDAETETMRQDWLFNLYRQIDADEQLGRSQNGKL